MAHDNTVVLGGRERTQLKLDSPDAFNFRKPEEWATMMICLEQFRVASGR